MQRSLSCRKDADRLYAELFGICHSPMPEDGRKLCVGAKSDSREVQFEITTPHGPLLVTVPRDAHAALAGRVGLRFVAHPRVCPPADGGEDYNQSTGTWDLSSTGIEDFEALLVRLSARLDWAQRRPSVPREQSLLSFTQF